jgi:hypothetical protein
MSLVHPVDESCHVSALAIPPDARPPKSTSTLRAESQTPEAALTPVGVVNVR